MTIKDKDNKKPTKEKLPLKEEETPPDDKPDDQLPPDDGNLDDEIPPDDEGDEQPPSIVDLFLDGEIDRAKEEIRQRVVRSVASEID